MVIAASTAHRQVAVFGGCDQLKHRLGIIIQATHNAAVHLIGNTAGRKALLQLCKVRLAIIAQHIQHAGRVLYQLLALVLLAIQHAEGVALKAALTGGTHLVNFSRQVFLEHGMVLRPALRAANGIDVHRKVLNPQ